MYDWSVRITHLKGVSVGKDHACVARAISDVDRDIALLLERLGRPLPAQPPVQRWRM